MKMVNVLVLTDHSGHSKSNSLYGLVKAFRRDNRVQRICVASRGIEINSSFFKDYQTEVIYTSEVGEDFSYTKDGDFFSKNLEKQDPRSFDLILLRIPPGFDISFLEFLSINFSKQCLINNPMSIAQVGSKAYLMKFDSLCPPMKLCKTKSDIIEFKEQFPIVLKPLREYGGKGIVKIEGEKVFMDDYEMLFSDFLNKLDDKKIEFLAVKYLKNVNKGDKRIIVINGTILGASLRLPPEGSWLCNVAQGGLSIGSDVEEEEIEMIRLLDKDLRAKGIVAYGVDTLLNDDGRRVLSEVNTVSVGGIIQLEEQMRKPLIKKAVDLILEYYYTKSC